MSDEFDYEATCKMAREYADSVFSTIDDVDNLPVIDDEHEFDYMGNRTDKVIVVGE